MKLKELIMNMSSYNMDAEVDIKTADGKRGKVNLQPIDDDGDDTADRLTVTIVERELTEEEILEEQGVTTETEGSSEELT